MVSEKLVRALEALAGEHGLPILRFMRDRDWTLASHVAEGLEIHTTTASKYLAAFLEVGFLKSRPHRGKSSTREYRLRSPVIRIEFSLSDLAASSDVVYVTNAFVESLLDSARHVGGARLTANIVQGLFGEDDWRPALERRFASAADPRAVWDDLLWIARRICTNLVGAAATERLVQIAAASAFEGRQDIAEALGFAEVAT